MDEHERMGNCEVCGPVRVWRRSRNGKSSWKCSVKASGKLNTKRAPYRLHLKDSCERCGFVPEDLCQLDVHHKDEDVNNNDPDNLITLCANCHRLITILGQRGYNVALLMVRSLR